MSPEVTSTTTGKRTTVIISIAIIAIFLVGATIVSAWVAPTVPPPGGNVAPPINTGTGVQVKSGIIGANAFVGNMGAFIKATPGDLSGGFAALLFLQPALIAGNGSTDKGIMVSSSGDLFVNDGTVINGSAPVSGRVLTDVNGTGIATWQPISTGSGQQSVPKPTLSTTTTNVVSALDIKYVATYDQDGGDPRYNKAYCPDGYKVLGGGGRCGHNNRQIKESSPIIGNPKGNGGDNTWTKLGRTNTDTGIDSSYESYADGWLIDCGGTGDDFNIEVFAICAKEVTTDVVKSAVLNVPTTPVQIAVNGPITMVENSCWTFTTPDTDVRVDFDVSGVVPLTQDVTYRWRAIPPSGPASVNNDGSGTFILAENTTYTVEVTATSITNGSDTYTQGNFRTRSCP